MSHGSFQALPLGKVSGLGPEDGHGPDDADGQEAEAVPQNPALGLPRHVSQAPGAQPDTDDADLLFLHGERLDDLIHLAAVAVLAPALHRAGLQRLMEQWTWLFPADRRGVAARQNGEVPVQERDFHNSRLPAQVLDEGLEADLFAEIEQVLGVGMDDDDPGEALGRNGDAEGAAFPEPANLGILGKRREELRGVTAQASPALPPHERHAGRPWVFRGRRPRPFRGTRHSAHHRTARLAGGDLSRRLVAFPGADATAARPAEPSAAGPGTWARHLNLRECRRLALRVEQLHLGQLVLAHHALDQFLRPGSPRHDEIHKTGVIQQSLPHDLFQHRLRGDGVPAAGFEDTDEGHCPLFQFAGEVLLHPPRLQQRIAAQQEDQQDDDGKQCRPGQWQTHAAGYGSGHRNLQSRPAVLA